MSTVIRLYYQRSTVLGIILPEDTERRKGTSMYAVQLINLINYKLIATEYEKIRTGIAESIYFRIMGLIAILLFKIVHEKKNTFLHITHDSRTSALNEPHKTHTKQ
jgi:tryptophan-rich sensory protein